MSYLNTGRPPAERRGGPTQTKYQMSTSRPSVGTRPATHALPPQSDRDGIVRTRSLLSATRSSLSPSARPAQRAAGAADSTAAAARVPLLERLPSAAQALRYEAVLDAFAFMGKDVITREFDDYAAAGLPVVFACARPLPSGDLDVGLALPAGEHEGLVACDGEFPHATIRSKFTLGQDKPINGQQMQWIRLASRAVV